MSVPPNELEMKKAFVAANSKPKASELLEFTEIQPASGPKKKTKTWRVGSKLNGSFLGIVEWYAPWRRFTFEPVHTCKFDPGCLIELAIFCKSATDARKDERLLEMTPPPVTGVEITVAVTP